MCEATNVSPFGFITCALKAIVPSFQTLTCTWPVAAEVEPVVSFFALRCVFNTHITPPCFADAGAAAAIAATEPTASHIKRRRISLTPLYRRFVLLKFPRCTVLQSGKDDVLHPRNVGARWVASRHRLYARIASCSTPGRRPAQAEQGVSRSPLTDSNRRPPPYHGGCGLQLCDRGNALGWALSLQSTGFGTCNAFP